MKIRTGVEVDMAAQEEDMVVSRAEFPEDKPAMKMITMKKIMTMKTMMKKMMMTEEPGVAGVPDVVYAEDLEL